MSKLIKIARRIAEIVPEEIELLDKGSIYGGKFVSELRELVALTADEIHEIKEYTSDSQIINDAILAHSDAQQAWKIVDGNIKTGFSNEQKEHLKKFILQIQELDKKLLISLNNILNSNNKPDLSKKSAFSNLLVSSRKDIKHFLESYYKGNIPKAKSILANFIEKSKKEVERINRKRDYYDFGSLTDTIQSAERVLAQLNGSAKLNYADFQSLVRTSNEYFDNLFKKRRFNIFSYMGITTALMGILSAIGVVNTYNVKITHNDLLALQKEKSHIARKVESGSYLNTAEKRECLDFFCKVFSQNPKYKYAAKYFHIYLHPETLKNNSRMMSWVKETSGTYPVYDVTGDWNEAGFKLSNVLHIISEAASSASSPLEIINMIKSGKEALILVKGIHFSPLGYYGMGNFSFYAQKGKNGKIILRVKDIYDWTNMSMPFDFEDKEEGKKIMESAFPNGKIEKMPLGVYLLREHSLNELGMPFIQIGEWEVDEDLFYKPFLTRSNFSQYFPK